MIEEQIKNEIRDELRAVAREENVTILWACESGSRAWGFESRDSDYDVRFIYLRSTDAYLRVSPLRDVIEKPISNDLDISGWDLQKALGLFRKSNPPLLEWLQSPIVYAEFEGFRESLSALIPQYFSPIGCMYHYMSMADRNRRSYLQQDQIRFKRYFYMLRPVLACMWIEQGLGTPPIEFQCLLDRLVPKGTLRNEIELLMERKKSGDESQSGPQIPIISEFIVDQMNRIKAVTKETQFTSEWSRLDEFFRASLLKVNGNWTRNPLLSEAEGEASGRRQEAGQCR